MYLLIRLRPVIKHLQLMMLQSEFVRRSIYRYRVFAAPTGGAIVIRRQSRTRQQPFQRHITDTVHFEKFFNLFQIAIICQQLFFSRKVYAVKTGMPDWRTAHSHMDLFRTSLAQCSNLTSCGCAADYRIVYYYNTSAFHNLFYHRKLKFDLNLPHLLLWTDKCPTYIVAPDHSHVEWY